MPEFFLGVHRPNWLALTSVPLFVSRRRLSAYRQLPRALGGWALDSGGFTELSLHGGWQLTAAAYASEVRRYRDEVGHLQWAAPQDWMCEPLILKQTGLSVRQHQARTLANYIELRERAPDLPWIAVLQGWSEYDYLRHVDDYLAAGVDLRKVARVGLGTICRRQATDGIASVVQRLWAQGLPLHAFGMKLGGLRHTAPLLASADSMAWSFRARRSEPMPGHTHMNCANCLPYALMWRERVLQAMCEVGECQLSLPA